MLVVKSVLLVEAVRLAVLGQGGQVGWASRGSLVMQYRWRGGGEVGAGWLPPYHQCHCYATFFGAVCNAYKACKPNSPEEFHKGCVAVKLVINIYGLRHLGWFWWSS